MQMNAKKKLALLLSLVLLLMLLPASVQAEEAVAEIVEPPLYLALGDSISFGLTDLNSEFELQGGYVAKFDDFLDAYLDNQMIPLDIEYDSVNLSYPGDTTLDLLGVIGKNHKMVKNAEVISISIGSNHLLGPAIEAIVGLYGLNPDDFSALDGRDMLMALAMLMKADWTDGGETPADRIASLMMPTIQAAELDLAWTEGAAMFTRKWPLIISRIRRDNPDAEIIVNNIYNPLKLSVMANSTMEPLYTSLEGYVQQLNAVIEDHQTAYSYKIVDVHELFAPSEVYSGYLSDPMNTSGGWFTAPVLFNIPMALYLTMTPSFNPANPSQFLPFFFSCDPHPSTAGHFMISGAVIAQYIGVAP